VRNRGELAEGYYDPATKSKADQAETRPPQRHDQDDVHDYGVGERQQSGGEDDEDYGPALPGAHGSTRTKGPAVASLEDIQHRNGMIILSKHTNTF